MTPLPSQKPWWPAELGQPTTAGAQNGMRYAVFAQARRLLVEDGGALSTYDSGDTRITGARQQDGASRGLLFTSDEGTVDLESLRRLD